MNRKEWFQDADQWLWRMTGFDLMDLAIDGMDVINQLRPAQIAGTEPRQAVFDLIDTNAVLSALREARRAQAETLR
jgi:hypothetical protein